MDDDGRGGRGMSARPPLDLASVGRGGSGMSGRGVLPVRESRASDTGGKKKSRK